MCVDEGGEGIAFAKVRPVAERQVLDWWFHFEVPALEDEAVGLVPVAGRGGGDEGVLLEEDLEAF